MKWFESNNPNGFVTGKKFSVDEPCPTVMAAGMAGDSLGHWHIHDDGKPEKPMIANTSKPPYRVPSMEEIRAIPWNGYTVASTFSGAGGSCTGYRMAGFKVVWANEFVPAAQDSYRANAAPGSILDPRDIKLVSPEEILKATGLQKGQLDIFDGSPPCQAFSTAGKREKGWGENKKYEHGATQLNETLFDQYIRLLRGLMPKTFVAENVGGLIQGKAKGFFLDILRDLKASGYRVECQVLDAQWLGVPQRRTRVIFMGVRNDVGLPPAFPKPLPYSYTVRDALHWIEEMIVSNDAFKPIFGKSVPSPTIVASGANGQSGFCVDKISSPVKPTALEPETDITNVAGKVGNFRVEHDESGQWSEGNISDRPAPTVRSGLAGTMFVTDPDHTRHESNPDRRKFTIAEVKRICAFPDDYILTGTYAQQWERLGNSVPPVMMSHIAKEIRDRVLNLAGNSNTKI